MKEQCLSLLKENNIAHAFFHAPLDDAVFGTSSALADALKLTETYKEIPYGEIYLAGVIGVLENPIDFGQFEKSLSDILGEPIRAFKNNRKPVHKICVATGGGNMTTDIKIAVVNDCDTYITGEYSLYSQQYSKFAGINLMVGSHTNTEILGVFQLVNKLIENTNIEAIRLAEENY
jgi:putative NIF3 family GTP cyclohydrolase 1 type 2